jgi:hypothetical protein
MIEVFPEDQCELRDPKPQPLSPKTYQTRSILTKMQAREIFSYKIGHGFKSDRVASAFLSSKFKISAKAIRDIWTGRSWLETTFDLWLVSERPARKVLGRPKGKKDSQPRKNKSLNGRLEKKTFKVKNSEHFISVPELRPGCAPNCHIERKSVTFLHRTTSNVDPAFQHNIPELRMSVLSPQPFVPIRLPSIHSVRLFCLADIAP